MTSKIDLVESNKIVAFKKSIREKLDNFREDRVVLEKNTYFEKLAEETTDNSYDDDSEVIDFEEIDKELEDEIMKEFGKEIEG